GAGTGSVRGEAWGEGRGGKLAKGKAAKGKFGVGVNRVELERCGSLGSGVSAPGGSPLPRCYDFQRSFRWHTSMKAAAAGRGRSRGNRAARAKRRRRPAAAGERLTRPTAP